MFLMRLAATLRRVLLIDWGLPTRLEEFLLPAGLDWRLQGLALDGATSTNISWPVMAEEPRVGATSVAAWPLCVCVGRGGLQRNNGAALSAPARRNMRQL